MNGDLLLLMAEAVCVYLLVLGVHALRVRCGLAPFYAMLGAVTAVMSWVTDAGIQVEAAGITFMVGSAVFYTALLLGVFVVYVMDGPRAARIAILTVAGVSVLVPVIEVLLHAQTHLAGYAPLARVPLPSLRINAASVAATVADLIFLAMVWEFLGRPAFKLGAWQRTFLTLLGVLWLDVILFATGAFAGTPAYLSILSGTLLSRLAISLFACPFLLAYLAWQNRMRGPTIDHRPVQAILTAEAEARAELGAAQREIERHKRGEERAQEDRRTANELLTQARQARQVLLSVVEDQKKAEAALRESEARLRTLLEAAPEGIFVQSAGRFVFLNPAMLRILGASEAGDLLGTAFTERVAPEYHEAIRERIQQQRETGMPAQLMDQEYLRLDGSRVPVETTGVAIRFQDADAHLVFVRDVTVRRQAEEALRQKMDDLQVEIAERKRAEVYRQLSNTVLAIINKASRFDDSVQQILATMKQATGCDAVGMRLQSGEDFPYFAADGFSADFLLEENTLILRDPQGGVCRGADGAVRLEGLCGLVLAGRTDPSNPLFTPGGSCWTNRSGLVPDVLARGGDPQLHLRSRCARDGYHSVALIPIRARTEIVGLLQLNSRKPDGFSRTAIEALEGIASHIGEALMRKQIEEFRIARETADAANRAKSAFLAHMSHEIRTPLNAILGFAQLLRREAITPRQQQHVETINRSGEHLLELINAVLELSKIEAGRVVLNPVAFDCHAMLADVAMMFRDRTEMRHLQFDVQRADNLPRFVKGDESKMREVLINLLGNAVKFTRQGSVTLRADAAREPAGLRLQFQVQDTGIGIAPDDQARLFRYFEQATAGHAIGAGTGLGLAISRELARLMGGDVSVSSEVGTGSTFRFHVLAGVAQQEDVQTVIADRHVIGVQPGQPRIQVLVADDREDNRRLLIELLAPIGCDIRQAGDGREALRLFEAAPPDLLLIDMRMPELDGIEVVRRIRQRPGGRGVRIGVVTANAFAEIREEAMSAGADFFLAKPFREADLFAKIGELLGLAYLWSDAADPTASETAPAAGELAALPDGLRGDIREAAIRGDFDRVQELAIQVEKCGHPVVAGALLGLAARFDAARLLELLGEEGA